MKRLLKRLLLSAVLLLLILFGSLAYSFIPMKLDVVSDDSWVSPKKNDPAALPEVALSLLNTGKMSSRQVLAYRGGSWGSEYEYAMAAILVRHPQATFLFDAGFGTNVDEHIKTIPALMQVLSSYAKAPPAITQLQQHGITADQIKMIIISHSHWDHISGLEDFPGVEVWMPRAEVEFIHQQPQSELSQQMIAKLKLRPIDFTSGPYENFDRSLDLFSDGSVVLVPLPGHTPGSTGMFVNLQSGKRFLFIGDLTWALDGVLLPAERPWLARRLVDYDEAQLRRSIVKVHRLAQQDPDLIVVPAHDRRVHDRIANFPNLER